MTCPISAEYKQLLETIGDPQIRDEGAQERLVKIKRGQELWIRRDPITPNAGKSICDRLDTQMRRARIQMLEEPDNKKFIFLPAPEDFPGELITISGPVCADVGVCSVLGEKHDELEDRYLITAFILKAGNQIFSVPLFGIFDGHGGTQAACYVRDNLERILAFDLAIACKDGLNAEKIWNVLKNIFVRLNEQFLGETSGTTAIMAMILDMKLWIANLGDSRIILDNGKQLSEDAKTIDGIIKDTNGQPTRLATTNFTKGVCKRGCTVEKNHRLNGILEVPRAVGDRDIAEVATFYPEQPLSFKPFISARSKVTVYPLVVSRGLQEEKKPVVFVMACDGIFDVASTRQVATAVLQNGLTLTVDQLARNIVYSAVKAKSWGDDCTALVVALNPTPWPQRI